MRHQSLYRQALLSDSSVEAKLYPKLDFPFEL